jgi:hemolysin III
MDRGERFNTLTHLIGATLALAGMVILIVFASLQGDPWKIVSYSIYGFSLFTLYLVSTLYHGLRGKAKNVFYVLDHQAIYFLIAGTYTPFTLVTLNGAWGWSLFGAIWGIAIVGFVLDALPVVRRGKRILPVIIYVAMGWLVVIALEPLLQELPEQGFKWLLYGGLLYTGGIVFYALSGIFTYAHGIWHLFVLAGSISHYTAILMYVE